MILGGGEKGSNSAKVCNLLGPLTCGKPSNKIPLPAPANPPLLSLLQAVGGCLSYAAVFP